MFKRNIFSKYSRSLFFLESSFNVCVISYRYESLEFINLLLDIHKYKQIEKLKQLCMKKFKSLLFIYIHLHRWLLCYWTKYRLMIYNSYLHRLIDIIISNKDQIHADRWNILENIIVWKENYISSNKKINPS